MPDKYTELELKFDASNVKTEEFLEWCWSFKPTEFVLVQDAVDDYYSNGKYVQRLRHKGPGGIPELTTKLKRSEKSITDRLEVDLKPNNSVEDIQEFIKAIGFKKEFSLVKEAHIFLLGNNKYPVTIVLYDVFKMDKDDKVDFNRIIEVEIEKNTPDISNEAGKRHLRTWEEKIKAKFNLNRITKSLYEIYSGSLYGVISNGD